MPAPLPAPLGRAMTKTPTKPIETAIQRSRLTRSLRSGHDNAVRNKRRRKSQRDRIGQWQQVVGKERGDVRAAPNRGAAELRAEPIGAQHAAPRRRA